MIGLSKKKIQGTTESPGQPAQSPKRMLPGAVNVMPTALINELPRRPDSNQPKVSKPTTIVPVKDTDENTQKKMVCVLEITFIKVMGILEITFIKVIGVLEITLYAFKQ